MLDDAGLRSKVLDESRVGRDGAVFIVGYRARRVTVYSQQVRALNLIWAAERQPGDLAGKTVVVVGGGIAGLTAAAAAAVRDAKVIVLEKSDVLLPLQRGCFNRFLHPHIYDWPKRIARGAGAHLPVLEWTVGSADEVAAQILARFAAIRKRVDITCVTGARGVAVDADGYVSWSDVEGTKGRVGDMVILSVGFGIERTVPGLARRSYWRVDDLSQESLDPERATPSGKNTYYSLFVAGIGDGGCIDVVRGVIREFDHGPFLDECVRVLEPAEPDFLALEHEFRKRCADAAAPASGNGEREDATADWLAGAWNSKLSPTTGEALRKLDAILERESKRNAAVMWTGRLRHPLDSGTRPLNRVLTWRLRHMGLVKYRRGSVEHVQLVQGGESSSPNVGYGASWYAISASTPDGPWKAKAAQVLIRYGCAPSLERDFGNLDLTLTEASEDPELIPAVFEHFRMAYHAKGVLETRGHMQIMARVDKKAGSGRTVVLMPGGVGRRYQCYRIEVWVENAPEDLRSVEYDLHPEYGGIRKRSIATPRFEQWVLAYDDFWLRARTSEGVETACWLSEALRRGADAGSATTVAALADLRHTAGELTGSAELPGWALDARAPREPWTGTSSGKLAMLVDALNMPGGGSDNDECVADP